MPNLSKLAQKIAALAKKSPVSMARESEALLPMDTASQLARAKEQGFNVEAYHGTATDKVPFVPSGGLRVSHPDTGIEAFDTTLGELGTHFGTKEQANEFAQSRQHGAAYVVPVRLALENPLRLEDPIEWDAVGLLAQLEKVGIASKSLSRRYRDSDAPSSSFYPAIQRLIQQHGYDGIVYLNRWEAVGQNIGMPKFGARGNSDADFLASHPGARDSYIAFSPNQIRSIFAKFDPAKRDSPDMMAAVIPPMPVGALALGQQQSEPQRSGALSKVAK